MEKRTFYGSKSRFLAALFPAFMILGTMPFKKHAYFFDFNAAFSDLPGCYIDLLAVCIAIVIFIYNVKTPELEYKNRILKFNDERDGDKNEVSLNVLDIKSVVLTNRLTNTTDDVNLFPYLEITAKDGGVYGYVPIKNNRHMKRMEAAIEFLNHCPGVPPVQREILVIP